MLVKTLRNVSTCNVKEILRVNKIGLNYIIIIKKCRQCTAGRKRLTHYQSEDPGPTISRIERKKKNENQEKTKMERAA